MNERVFLYLIYSWNAWRGYISICIICFSIIMSNLYLNLVIHCIYDYVTFGSLFSFLLFCGIFFSPTFWIIKKSLQTKSLIKRMNDIKTLACDFVMLLLMFYDPRSYLALIYDGKYASIVVQHLRLEISNAFRGYKSSECFIRNVYIRFQQVLLSHRRMRNLTFNDFHKRIYMFLSQHVHLCMSVLWRKKFK